jgi:hypothetical protein
VRPARATGLLVGAIALALVQSCGDNSDDKADELGAKACATLLPVTGLGTGSHVDPTSPAGRQVIAKAVALADHAARLSHRYAVVATDFHTFASTAPTLTTADAKKHAGEIVYVVCDR